MSVTEEQRVATIAWLKVGGLRHDIERSTWIDLVSGMQEFKVAGESMEKEAYLSFLQEDIVFEASGMPPVQGKEAISQQVDMFNALLESKSFGIESVAP